nr:hypothetical protein [Tanacetum cinerariifolium]
LLPPPEPPDKEFNSEKEILVMRNAIVKFEFIDARVKFEKVHSQTGGALSWPPVPCALLPCPLAFA